MHIYLNVCELFKEPLSHLGSSVHGGDRDHLGREQAKHNEHILRIYLNVSLSNALYVYTTVTIHMLCTCIHCKNEMVILTLIRLSQLQLNDIMSPPHRVILYS